MKLAEGGEYNILVRYCNSSKAGSMKATVNGTTQVINFEKVAKNDWHEASVTVTLEAGTNDFVLQNSGRWRLAPTTLSCKTAEPSR